MTSRTHVLLAGALALALPAGEGARAETADGARPLVLAQAPLSEQEKAKRKEEKKPPPQGSPRQGPPPSRQGPPPVPPGKAQGPPPQPGGRSANPSPDREPPQRQRRTPSAEPSPSGPPPVPRSMPPPPPPPKATQPLEPRKTPDGKREPWKREVMPKQPGPPEGGGPKAFPKARGPASPPDSGGPSHAGPGRRGPDAASIPPRFIDVQKGRKERVIDGRRVIEEPGNRTIVRQGDRIVIRHNDADRFRRGGRDVRSERRPNGHTETFYMRPDGVRVVTVVDGHGRMVRRYRRGHDGREVNIIDNRRFLRNVAIGVGIGAVGVALLTLGPPRVAIAREKYIVDYDHASDDDLDEVLSAPPVDRLERAYSLEEVRDNYELRQRMRHVELGNIHFEFGAWEVTPDQYPKLERLAHAISRVLRRNPDEVFLIEGHTDAVGSDVDNLSLSDRRASSVAEILSENFGVPPENLVTQGYGEQFLKVQTEGPEPRNRRVYARRITPLMSEQMSAR